jgi:capsular exopolysaccharide synthesis family protein
MSKEINPWESNPNDSVDVNKQKTVQKPFNDVNFFPEIDLNRIVRIWPLVLLFGLLGSVFAYLYILYTVPNYQASMRINIQQKEEISLGEALFGTREIYNDKIEWLRSPSLAKHVVDNLGLNYIAIQKGVIKNKDLYGKLSWRIANTDSTKSYKDLTFSIIPNKNGFKLTYNNIEKNGNWGSILFVEETPIIIEKNGKLPNGIEIICSSYDPWQGAIKLSREININFVKESNIIEVNHNDISPLRAVNILNELVRVYNSLIVEEKELSFSKAIVFIDSRLDPVNSELQAVETESSNFKSKKGFTGDESNGGLYKEKMLEADRKLVEIRLQKELVQEIENYLKNPSLNDDNISLVGVSDSYLQSLVIHFQKLRTDRNLLGSRVTENNADLKELDKQIIGVKNNIILQLSNYKKNIQLSEKNYETLLNSSKRLVSNTPLDERILLEKQRQQNIKEQMFLLLLQKREEALIQKASITIDTKILKPALLPTTPVSPDKGQIYLICIFSGLLLPVISVIIYELSNRKIISRKQLEKITNVPVISELEFDNNASFSPLYMGLKTRSMLSEQIRALRANLFFYKKVNQPLVILVTSNMSQEGKTFISTNLAKSFSMLGERTALLELDLRRPTITKKFNTTISEGMSSVFLGRLNYSDIKVPLVEGEVFDLYPAGIIPPNPSELISSSYAAKFISDLKQNYDVIVIDTPPYGLVSDAQLIAKWCDVSIIVTRFNKTVVEQVKNIQRWENQGIFKSMLIVLNAIGTKGYYGYNYGYYYYMKKKGYNTYYTSSSSDKNQKNQSSDS